MTKKRPDAPDDQKPPESKTPLKPVVGFRVEPELLAALELLAEEEDRKMAQLVTILVREAMVARGRYQKPPRKPKPKE